MYYSQNMGLFVTAKLSRLEQTLNRIKGVDDVEQDIYGKEQIKSTNTPKKLMIKNKEGISVVDMDEIILA